MENNILITGGAGFIGSHLVRHFVNKYNNYKIFNLDLLTYAGNLENLKDIESLPNYNFIKGDIKDSSLINDIFKRYKFSSVIHLAAESHVDRSISDPLIFAQTNIIGTLNLLEAFRKYSHQIDSNKFYHVSTDEVYGSLGSNGFFTEETPYSPNSPYSASKASSDHFVRAYGETYKLPYIISNCSNNYGPFQFPEKLIPLVINNILNGLKIPVYGDGKFTRDWLYVEDHAEAIDLIFHKAKIYETYNIGGMNEYKNIDLVNVICNRMDIILGNSKGKSNNLIEFVKDRPGHDLRYAIDCSKLSFDLGWKPKNNFESGITKTINWYMDNKNWLNAVTSGKYLDYYNKQYK